MGGVLMVNSEFKQKVPQYSIAVHWSVAHCGSHLIILICNKFSPLHLVWKKNKLFLKTGFAHSVAPLSKVASWLSLGCLWPLLMQSSLATWQPWEPSYVSRLEPGGPPWLSLAFVGFLWPLLTSPASPARPLWEPSKYDPGGPPWFSFGRCSRSPVSLRDYHENHLI